MKKVLIIIFLYFISGCKNEIITISENAKIIAMYIVHDELHSPKLSKCSDLKNDFLKANKNACSFTMDGYEFDIEDKFIFNDDGKIIEFWNYHSEGPVVTKIKELKSKNNNLPYPFTKKFTIKWGKNKKVIITEKYTLKIDKIFPIYKLIWIKQDKERQKNGRRILIEYN